MLAAVKFDHKPYFKADEISDEGTYGNSAAKLEIGKPPIAQGVPQLPLRLR